MPFVPVAFALGAAFGWLLKSAFDAPVEIIVKTDAPPADRKPDDKPTESAA